MALIKVGSINDFSVCAKPDVLLRRGALRCIGRFNELEAASLTIEPDSFELSLSPDERGITLKNITLREGFEGFLANLFDATQEVYFVAWAWDLSGEKINYYPGEGIEAKDVIIPMKVGRLREFIGEGINLFPKRKVKGGIALRIQLWECDQNMRTFGKVVGDIANMMQNSQLGQLLHLIATATGVTASTISLIKDAAIELGKVVSHILQANGDDYVDFFEGYYPATSEWSPGDESYEGNSSMITLRRY